MSDFDWATVLSGIGQGAGSAMQGISQFANTKDEAKEAKRRTLANLLSSANKRNRSLFKKGQEHVDDMRDYQSQALQQIARGFVESLQGANRG